MTVVLGLVVGAVAVQFLRIGAAGMLASPVLARANHRGRLVPTSGGILIVLAVLVIEAGRAILGALGVGDEPGLTIQRTEVLFAVFAFGLLGFIDDVVGDSSARGFRGHLRALFHGQITTGFLKLFGGAGVAIVLVATPGFATGRRLLIDAVLIALAANLGNLLDRAPGRTLKAAAVAYVPLAIVLGDGAVGVAIAPAMGAAFGLLGEDVRERLMLGDAGANVVGAVLGLGVVLGRGEVSRGTALAFLVVANVAAELVSFSSIIDRVPPLRWFDRLGRPSPDDPSPEDAQPDRPPPGRPPPDHPQSGRS
jgi:UDP-N-acetylmuramyl pentapeptide phosphotransferase/UDP-N-acetylglucosamine-1-phosphate transferase